MAGQHLGHNVTLLQVIIISIVQGASELFPVSSLGHAIVFPVLFNWDPKMMDSTGPYLPFLVTLHLGTAIALLAFYWKDWARLVGAAVKGLSGKSAMTPDEKTFMLLIAGTIPTAAIAFLFEKQVKQLFSSPFLVAIFLIANGVLMIVAEHLRRAADVAPGEEAALVATGARKPLSQLTYIQALGVGFAQSLALLPGISRSGATIVGGLLSRLTHTDAARYSFLLGTPIILLAAIHQVPTLGKYTGTPHIVEYSAIGLVLAGITAYLSVKFLTKYFETNRLDPFGYYCIVLGAVTIGVLKMHGHAG